MTSDIQYLNITSECAQKIHMVRCWKCNARKYFFDSWANWELNANVNDTLTNT